MVCHFRFERLDFVGTLRLTVFTIAAQGCAQFFGTHCRNIVTRRSSHSDRGVYDGDRKARETANLIAGLPDGDLRGIRASARSGRDQSGRSDSCRSQWYARLQFNKRADTLL